MATVVHGEYEWDARKNEANIAKHAIGFVEALEIFEGVVFERASLSYQSEARVMAIGMRQSREIVVIYTQRHPRKRIISARRAKKHERKTYQTYLQTYDDGE